jgi:tetratricopeptide (TPR) repeat protein
MNRASRNGAFRNRASRFRASGFSASGFLAVACCAVATLAAIPSSAQGFGASKVKVTLQRKLPALVHLPSNTIKLTVSTADEDGTLPFDFQALLETELLKDDPDLREMDNAGVQILCQITEYSHPEPTVTKRAAPGISLSGSKPGVTATSNYTRITGQLNVSLQVKDSSGGLLISDNISATYDEEFDSSGNSASHGVFGSVTGTFGRVKGGGKSEDMNPPTPSELRSRLILDAVQQIAEHLVNSDEKIEVLLAQKAGPLDEGNKAAQAGLWERALETYETATPFPKPEDDAYRLYNVGVAYEALAYAASDEKMTMKYLDQAAINYGKAIDAKPGEKYFVDPQKRIETAIAHYKELDEEQSRAAREAASPATAAPKALTNTQIIAMVKSGVDEATIIEAIRGAGAVNFDLSAAGLHALTSNGVGPRVVTAMKAQAAKKPTAAVHKGLTNTQIIAMVSSGMDEDTIIKTIAGAAAVNFDLSASGQQQLSSGGVSARVMAAMKSRAAKQPNGKPAAAR